MPMFLYQFDPNLARSCMRLDESYVPSLHFSSSISLNHAIIHTLDKQSGSQCLLPTNDQRRPEDNRFNT